MTPTPTPTSAPPTAAAAAQAASIRTATAADEERAIAALTLAFVADPALRWLYSDPYQFWTHFPEFLRAFGGRAFVHGTAHLAEHEGRCVGAALWLPPGVHPDEEALMALLQRSIPAHRQEVVLEVLGQMDAYHPKEPHWYLPVLGVDPPRQGAGHGSALLRHALARCDRDQLPAYLESSNPANLPLYERHGFEAIGIIQAGASPPAWPMLRQPR
jgi:ribosomal protein S18 acetylase RimI-like enzyme